MTASQLRPNGIRVGQMQIPIGVILMIYESRPNVTVEASSLCFKSGNAIVLRGGSEAFYSNTCIADLLKACLREHALPDSLIQMVSTRERSVLNDLLTMHESIDLVIPRGGQSLIEYVSENSRIPVIQHYKGVCHLYVDEHADLEQACRLLINGKAQRPGVCNALETCLVHENTASEFLKLAKTAIEQANIEVRGCAVTCQHLSSAKAAVEQDYYEEFLDTIIAMKVVPDMASAIDHIRQYGSQHTEVICTENYSQAQAFMRAVNSSVVMVNASSRFSDGGQLGLGAEIGISTSKLHAYGPMGLDALTTKKFVVFGNGQIRE